MTSDEDKAKEAYATIGELVLMASALDHQLNRICIAVLPLVDSPMLEPMIASIDSSRKIEILRGYAKNITASQWMKILKKYLGDVESVNRSRNIAAHSDFQFHAGRPFLFSLAAAKLFKSIDLKSKVAERTEIRVLEQAIRRGEAALSAGENLLQNFSRVAEERERRKNAVRQS